MIRGMNNPSFHFCKVCKRKFFKNEYYNMTIKDWAKRKYCSKDCLLVARRTGIQKHWMLGKSPSEEMRKKISNTLKGHPSNANQLRGLKVGQQKVWTTEMREKMSEHAKRHKLGTQRGPAHNRWNGGLTPLVKRYRTDQRYKVWRTACFERDNYTCLKCGFRGDLEVNHIVTVKEIFHKYNFTDMDEVYACEILWDTNNGETLCKSCHRLISPI